MNISKTPDILLDKWSRYAKYFLKLAFRKTRKSEFNIKNIDNDGKFSLKI